jgi:predicted enzyme related to lactoylglutathione lyase
MSPPSLRHAILFVVDVATMTAFYRDGLGLAVDQAASQPGWVVLDAGGAALALHAILPAVAATISLTSPPAAREDTPIKLGFEVDDLEAARARLTAHGAIMQAPTSWGTCDGVDPEGNVLQLVARRRS